MLANISIKILFGFVMIRSSNEKVPFHLELDTYRDVT